MKTSDVHKFFDAKLSKRDFDRLSDFIFSNYGIKMPPAKHIMLQSRLQKRLRALDITNFDEYVNYVFSKKGIDEIVHMIDVVSTNKTDFFREPQHFDFLRDTVLNEAYNYSKQRFFKLWSAGCSSGEEVYTLAMVLSEFNLKNHGIDFSILGTDISTQVLQKAITAIYSLEKVNVIPLDIKKKYLLKSKNKDEHNVRIIPELRSKTSFQRVNFMDNVYTVNENYDIIFCRNVLIYFDRQTQEKVINRLSLHLKPGGYFFLGHSESVTGLDVPLKQIKPTIFRKL
jgi:chemotaxis protein methyltransferase CheR